MDWKQKALFIYEYNMTKRLKKLNYRILAQLCWLLVSLIVVGIVGITWGPQLNLITPTLTGSTPSPTPLTEGGQIGAQVGPEEAAVLYAGLQRNGVAATPLWLRWGDVDAGNGQYTWSVLDRQVAALRACGLEVALHVQARHRGELSTMPQDLDEYTRFLTALVTHLHGQVRRYSLENEAVSPASWSGSPENYFRLLDAAYRAIKTADPKAIVLNSGLSSAALGITWAYDLYQTGWRAEALILVQQTLIESTGGLASRRPQTEADLNAVFKDPVAARAIAWLPLLVQHQDSYDALQIHYYGPSQRLPDLLHWLRGKGLSKPLEAWELGRRYKGQIAFNETTHAQETTRLLVMAAGEGSRFSILVRYLDWPQKGLPGLLTRQGPRLAAVAFRVVAHNLNGFQTAERLNAGAGVWSYHFTRPQGELYVLWTDGELATVSLPLAGAKVNVTDVEGWTTMADPSRLSIGPSPVFVTPCVSLPPPIINKAFK